MLEVCTYKSANEFVLLIQWIQIDLIGRRRELIGIDSNRINKPFLDPFLVYRFLKVSYIQLNSRIGEMQHKLFAFNINNAIFINLTECKLCVIISII